MQADFEAATVLNTYKRDKDWLERAFRESKIISVTIPSSVKTIGDSAFYNCGNLSSVTVCEGVETIGQNAFRACANLGSIAFPPVLGRWAMQHFFNVRK